MKLEMSSARSLALPPEVGVRTVTVVKGELGLMASLSARLTISTGW